MKKSFLILLCSVAVCATASAQRMEILEYAAEYTATAFGKAPLNNGLIYVKRCDQCERTSVRFTAKTSYFHGGAPINANRAVELDGNSATLFFHPKSRRVTRVVFSKRSETRD